MANQLKIKHVVSIPDNVKPVLGDHGYNVLCDLINTLLTNGIKLQITYTDVPAQS